MKRFQLKRIRSTATPLRLAARFAARPQRVPLCRHGRNESTAVRFRFCGPGESLEHKRVSGGLRDPGHEFRHAGIPPTVTPDLFRGPDCQAPLLPGFPRTGVRGEPGPRNKSGVTTGGRRRSRSSARSPSQSRTGQPWNKSGHGCRSVASLPPVKSSTQAPIEGHASGLAAAQLTFRCSFGSTKTWPG